MMRLLAAAALTVASLFVVAAPAAAAPPEKVVDSQCTFYSDDEITICVTLNLKIKETVTPSGNLIYHFTGTELIEATDASGATISTLTYISDQKSVVKAGEVGTHVVRSEGTVVVSERGQTCTFIGEFKFKFTNGKVQIDYNDVTCTPS